MPFYVILWSLHVLPVYLLSSFLKDMHVRLIVQVNFLVGVCVCVGGGYSE